MPGLFICSHCLFDKLDNTDTMTTRFCKFIHLFTTNFNNSLNIDIPLQYG